MTRSVAGPMGERRTAEQTGGKPTDKWAFLLPPGWARIATDAGAMYLPTEPMAGMTVPASITETELFGVVGRSPVEVATSILGDSDEENELVELDGRPGVRVSSTVQEPPAADGGPAVFAREVTYVVSRHEADGDWLVLSFRTTWNSPGTERLAEVLVTFFDAVLTTFRWTGHGARPVSLPEREVPGSA
ncbi:hypothetical protein AB1046_08310 [Promicromonospora sp. Populi]|uniref:hypothetical protein n=1 Tax=Promicromonospora sp. Populi TaxID=3239420 RepID=UPI0034E19D9B